MAVFLYILSMFIHLTTSHVLNDKNAINLESDTQSELMDLLLPVLAAREDHSEPDGLNKDVKLKALQSKLKSGQIAIIVANQDDKDKLQDSSNSNKRQLLRNILFESEDSDQNQEQNDMDSEEEEKDSTVEIKNKPNQGSDHSIRIQSRFVSDKDEREQNANKLKDSTARLKDVIKRIHQTIKDIASGEVSNDISNEDIDDEKGLEIIEEASTAVEDKETNDESENSEISVEAIEPIKSDFEEAKDINEQEFVTVPPQTFTPYNERCKYNFDLQEEPLNPNRHEAHKNILSFQFNI